MDTAAISSAARPGTMDIDRQSFDQTMPGSLPTQNEFSVEVNLDERATVVTVTGELDLATSPELEAELERTTTGPDLVILDLRGVSFMDSTGLSLLVKAQRRAQDAQQQLAVVKGGAQVQRLLKLTGVADRLTLVDAPEQVLP
jgi:anti-sigma B factor antagonist